MGAIGLGHAFSWGAMGGTLRLFRGQLAEYSNWGYAGDFGLQWRTTHGLSLGAALQHIGEQTAFLSARDALPALARVGAQFIDTPSENLSLSSSIDVLLSQDPSRGPELRLGGEVEVFQRLALRLGGQRQDNQWNPSFGLGFKLGSLALAYAYRPVESLGSDHVITLSLQNFSDLFVDDEILKK